MATSAESAGIDGITTITVRMKGDTTPSCLKGTSVTFVDANSERSKN
jgi:hypothetical protein